MIKECVSKLVDELPEKIIQKLKKTKIMNVILEGGIFNGSYLIGALYFLKELEQRKYIKIQKLSGCSIGGLCALLYLIDELNLVEELYYETMINFKETHSFKNINDLFEKILTKMSPNIYKKMKNKLYVCYYDVEVNKKVVESCFNDNAHLLDCIKRSCFIPFLLNGEIMYENQYLDGIFPYVFSLQERSCPLKKVKGIGTGTGTPEIRRDTKTLYLDLVGSDKLKYLISVKNEDSNFHRIMAGILDIHLFFMKENKTKMCSYVEDWTLVDKINVNILKYCIEKLIINIICIIQYLKVFLSKEKYIHLQNHKFFLLSKENIINSWNQFIEHYCF